MQCILRTRFANCNTFVCRNRPRTSQLVQEALNIDTQVRILPPCSPLLLRMQRPPPSTHSHSHSHSHSHTHTLTHTHTHVHSTARASSEPLKDSPTHLSFKLQDVQDHTFNGIMFDVKAADYKPLEFLLVESVWVRGALGPVVSNPVCSGLLLFSRCAVMRVPRCTRIRTRTRTRTRTNHATLYIDGPSVAFFLDRFDPTGWVAPCILAVRTYHCFRCVATC